MKDLVLPTVPKESKIIIIPITLTLNPSSCKSYCYEKRIYEPSDFGQPFTTSYWNIFILTKGYSYRNILDNIDTKQNPCVSCCGIDKEKINKKALEYYLQPNNNHIKFTNSKVIFNILENFGVCSCLKEDIIKFNLAFNLI